MHTDRQLYVTFNVRYMYDITKLCKQQAKVTLSYDNQNSCNTEQGDAQRRKSKTCNVKDIEGILYVL